jgi:hypothetical protein
MLPTTNPARRAGLLWFLTTVTGGFGLFYIRSRLIVPGDAARHPLLTERRCRTLP